MRIQFGSTVPQVTVVKQAPALQFGCMNEAADSVQFGLFESKDKDKEKDNRGSGSKDKQKPEPKKKPGDYKEPETKRIRREIKQGDFS
jgi:hypothetical protein